MLTHVRNVLAIGIVTIAASAAACVLVAASDTPGVQSFRESTPSHSVGSHAPIVSAELNVDRGLADYNETIRLNPNDASAYFNRGKFWDAKGDFDRAIADYSEAIRLDPKYAAAYNNRGLAWNDKG